MKIDQNVLIGGAVVVGLGIVVWYLLMGNGPQANSPLGEIVNKLEGKALTPGDEVEQAAMYGEYY